MKRIFATLIVLILFSSCSTNKSIENKSPQESLTNHIDKSTESDYDIVSDSNDSSLPEKVLAVFGNEMLLQNSWDDVNDIQIGSLVMWYAYYIQDDIDISKYLRDDKDGFFIPQDEFEKTVYNFFGLSPEHLRASETYDETENSYITPTALYGHIKTNYVITKTEVDNDIMKIYFSLFVGDSNLTERVLTVDISESKICFISYQ